MMCGRCEQQLAAALVSVWTYHGLAHDLDIALARQAVFGRRHGSRGSEKPLMFNERASDAAHELRNALVTWARVVYEETGADLPDDTLTAIARYLHKNISWLRHHEAADEIHAEITEAVRDVRKAVDRPADTIYVGPCSCGNHLFARLGAIYVTCNSPAHDSDDDIRQDTWSVAERVEWLLAQAEDVIATAAQICAALTHYLRPVTPAALRGLVRRGRLWPVDRDKSGAALYRLGDVMDLVAPDDTPQPEDTLLPVALIPDALARHGYKVPPATIKKYVAWSTPRPCWCTDPENRDDGGLALYRLGDFLELAAPRATPVEETRELVAA